MSTPSTAPTAVGEQFTPIPPGSNGSGSPAPTTTTTAPPPARAARRHKETIRYTLDLPREQHRFLKVFALDCDAEASKVMRAMLTLLDADTDLQDRVADLLAGVAE